MMTHEPPAHKPPGARIREFREARGMTGRALAAAVGCTESHIWRMEVGTKRPSLDMLQALAKALGVGKDDLWPVEDDAGRDSEACADSTPEADSNCGGASEVGP